MAVIGAANAILADCRELRRLDALHALDAPPRDSARSPSPARSTRRCGPTSRRASAGSSAIPGCGRSRRARARRTSSRRCRRDPAPVHGADPRAVEFEIAIVFVASPLGSIVGALVTNRVNRRIGVGPTILATISVSSVAGLCYPLAPHSFPMPLLMTGGALFGFGAVAYNITQVSLRQAITPERLQGRMNAAMRWIVWGTIPLGTLAAAVSRPGSACAPRSGSAGSGTCSRSFPSPSARC